MLQMLGVKGSSLVSGFSVKRLVKEWCTGFWPDWTREPAFDILCQCQSVPEVGCFRFFKPESI